MISAENMMRQPPEKVQVALMDSRTAEIPESSALCPDLMLSCAQLIEDHWTQLRHAAGAEGEDYVARLCR